MADFKGDILKLNNNNYSNWKYKVKLLLMKENIFKKVIEGTCPVAAEGNTNQKLIDDWEAADSRAQAYIGLTIEDDQLIHVRDKNTAKDMWETLKKYHEKSTLTNKVHLMRTICLLKLEEGGNAAQHITKMQELFLKLRDLGEQSLSDNWSVAMLLSSLPKSYDTLITALETRTETDLTFAVVQQKVIAEYERRQHAEATGVSQERMLKTVSSKDFKKSTSNTMKCFFCKKTGHMKQECRKYIAWKEKHPDKVNIVDSSRSTDSLFTIGIRSDSWILDSGATRHVTNDPSFFTSLDRSYLDRIEVANGDLVDVRGIGNGNLNFINGEGANTPIAVCDVLYVPNVVGNLVSVHQLTKDNFSVVFSRDCCEILKNGHQVGIANNVNNLYRLCQPYKINSVIEHKENCIHTWHRKMGHRDPEAIKKMCAEGLLADLSIVDCGIKMSCDTCMKGKLTRVPFPKQSTTESSDLLSLIHTDICGPMQTSTPGGKRYLVTFIDDFSRYTFVYLLSNKSDVPNVLKQYVALVQNQLGKKVKTIRSDRGGEYLNTHLRRYLADEGIKTQLTAAYSPQQNGVAERKNRTLIEMARCMLIDAGLPNKFWGEAVVTANFIQNRVLTKVRKLTPYELWCKEKPKVKNFQIFGSKCFVHIPTQKRQKLDCTGKEMIFLGYDEESKAYRCYDGSSLKVVISRDVKFSVNTHESENGSYNTSENTTQSNSTVEFMDQDVGIQEENGEATNSHEEPCVRVSQRSTKGIPPKRLIEEMHVAHGEIKEQEPRSFNEAMSSKFKNNWLDAMKEELSSLEENQTWDLCNLPEDRKAVGCKWVFKIKKSTDGKTQQFKARLVAQGFSQKYGEDYDETFAPVVRQTTLRTLLSVSAKEKFLVHHFDVKTAFLNGELTETIFMKQPPGFVKGDSTQVCLLKKSIYGLKQAAKVWNETIHKVIVDAEYQQSETDPCFYFKRSGDSVCFILIHVDDILVAGKSELEIKEVESILSNQFKIKSLGPVQHYLGIDVTRDSDGNFELCQSSYIRKICEDFGLTNSKPVKTPIDPNYEKSESGDMLPNNTNYRKLLGCLLYVAVNTRPDIAAGVSILAQKVAAPCQEDWTQLKQVAKYLKSTAKMKLKLSDIQMTENQSLHGYADANWAEDRRTRKSNSGYVFFLNGGVINWSCRKQTCVSLSSTEAEYIALSEACQEALWLRRLLKDMFQDVDNTTVMYEDNQSCLCWVSSGKFSNRSKHIDTKYHFVKDCAEKKLIECTYCPSESMIADLLTKPLPAKRHCLLRDMCKII